MIILGMIVIVTGLSVYITYEQIRMNDEKEKSKNIGLLRNKHQYCELVSKEEYEHDAVYNTKKHVT